MDSILRDVRFALRMGLPQPLSVLMYGAARRATGLVVSQSYFEVMGVRPAPRSTCRTPRYMSRA